jgi:hypothetical protein
MPILAVVGIDEEGRREVLDNKKPEPNGLWFLISSGEWIRTTDLRVIVYLQG